MILEYYCSNCFTGIRVHSEKGLSDKEKDYLCNDKKLICGHCEKEIKEI